jgi:hypothetical protein
MYVGLWKKKNPGSRCQVTGAGAMHSVVNCEWPSYFSPPPTALGLLPTAFKDLAGRFTSPTTRDKMATRALKRNCRKFRN